MKAMVLAAGLGTRLRPLTDDRPKALVEVAGHTLLEIALRRLRDYGIRDVIVNVHHFADKVAEYLAKNGNFEMRIELSREDILLDTGGGIKKASWFFLEDPTDQDQPILVHNVDVISTIDLDRLIQFHKERQSLATLAVQDRETSRYLLFDEDDELCGRQNGRNGERQMAGPARQTKPLAFCGVHVVSPRLFPLLEETGIFSIIDSYLRLAAHGEKILAFRADAFYWRDLGKPENILQAERDVVQQLIRL
jgi:NDP-sugar pyrophosphorylase family protein